MEFGAPYNCWLALPVVLVCLVRARGETTRSKDLRRFAETHLLPELLPSRLMKRRWNWVPAAVMLLLVAALMRPHWGVVDEEEKSSGADIVFAIDLSRSMLADDAAPSRLAAAKRGVARAIEALPGDRVAVVAFAGTAYCACPLTADHEMARRVLEELDTGSVPKGGTSLAQALREARKALGKGNPAGKMVVLVTDGEDLAGGMSPAVNELRQSGIVVCGAIVGTEGGALMPLPAGGFVKSREGGAVKSYAHTSAVRDLDPQAAVLTASTDALRERLHTVRAGLREVERKERRQRLAERFQIPLGAAVVVWCFAGLLRWSRVFT